MMARPDAESILVVDDAEDTLEVIRRNLASRGYRVFTARGVDEAVSLLAQAPVDLVVTDVKMPQASGLDLVRHVRENLAGTEVMAITGYATVPGAVEAMKEGAAEYLAKPFTDEELLGAVARALARQKARRAARLDPAAHAMPPGLMGVSPAMAEVMRLVAKAGASDAPALIVGESGTGKEMAARAIHYNSARAEAPFVVVNCGGVPENLLEGELFGRARGAGEARGGLFLAARGGTLFFDEIGDLPSAVQNKLLRVMEESQMVMEGGAKPVDVDARVLASTAKDLRALCDAGSFRQDLFHKLEAATVRLPPLRDRGGDTLLLAKSFMSRFAREHGRPAPRLTDRAIQALQGYHWPGNVRELKSLAQRLAETAEGGVIDAPDLPEPMRYSAAGAARLPRSLAEVESEHIRNVLASVGGNKTEAGRVLGIDRKTLRRKLAGMGLGG